MSSDDEGGAPVTLWWEAVTFAVTDPSAAADPAGEADRLASLGASRLDRGPDRLVLADPDGHEFDVRAGCTP